MRYIPIFLIVLLLLLVSQANAFKYEYELRHKFKDPDSIKFEEVKVYPSTKGTTSVCGRLNGKNSYGAYTGYTKFIYFPDLKIVMLEKDFSLEGIQDILDSYCITR